MGTAAALLSFWGGGSLIAGLSWFFSSRPRLYIRVFVPRDEWRDAARAFVRDPGWGRAMRQMALFQLAFAGLFGIVGLWRLPA
jgi:hypothetical protein